MFVAETSPFSLLALSSLCQVTLDNGRPAVRGGFQAGPQPRLPAMPPCPHRADVLGFLGSEHVDSNPRKDRN